jgi:hypothetical protein
MFSKYNRAVNSFRLAMGTAAYCQSCQALMAFGIESAKAMQAIGVPSQEWIGWLKKHEAYHTAKGEELPVEWTAAGLSQAFKDKVLAPKPKVKAKPVFVRKPLSDEDKALAKFNQLAGTNKQVNARKERPILKHIDATPFKGW